MWKTYPFSMYIWCSRLLLITESNCVTNACVPCFVFSMEWKQKCYRKKSQHLPPKEMVRTSDRLHTGVNRRRETQLADDIFAKHPLVTCIKRQVYLTHLFNVPSSVGEYARLCSLFYYVPSEILTCVDFTVPFFSENRYFNGHVRFIKCPLSPKSNTFWKLFLFYLAQGPVTFSILK